MNEHSELYEAGRSRRETSAHGPRIGPDPDPEGAALMRGAAVEGAAAVKGADAHFDAALGELIALERAAAGEYATVIGLEDAARAGRLPEDKAIGRAQDAGGEAERRYPAAIQRAERALEAARDAVILELLPEPPLDTATAMRRDELGRLLTAAKVGESPGMAFEAIFRDRAKAGDRAGVATLLSGWGRATFLEAGGTEERWAELRRGLAHRAADGFLKASPVAGKLRKLHGSEATKALHAAKNAAKTSVDRLAARGRR